jgi:hypothetical protein
VFVERRRFRSIAAVVVCGLVFAVTVWFLPRGGFWINDCGLKFLQVQALIAQGPWDPSIPWPGAVLDPGFQYVPIQPPFAYVLNGKLFAQYPPVFALLSTIPFRMLGSAGLYLLPLLGGLATLEAVRRLARALATEDLPAGSSVRIAEGLAVLVVGLATPVWFYSATFWEHTPAVALIASSLAWHLNRRSKTDGGVHGSAILLGLAACFRSDVYLFAAAWFVVLLIPPETRRLALRFLVVFLLACVPLWLYQSAALGRPLGLHHYGAHPFENGLMSFLHDRWTVTWNLLIRTHEHAAGSIPAIATWLLLGFSWLTRRNVSAAFRTAATAAATLTGAMVLANLWRSDQPMWQLFSANSLLAGSPLLILAMQPRSPRTSSDARRRVLAVLAGHIALYGLAAPTLNSEGIHWGCRFLMPAYPLLGAMAGVAATRVFLAAGTAAPVRLAQTALAVAVLAVSFAMQIGSIALLYRRQAAAARLNDIVSTIPGEVIVTDTWYAAQELAPIFFQRPIFLAAHRRDEAGLHRLLSDQGVFRVLHLRAWNPAEAPPGEAQVLDDGMGFLRFVVREP